MKESKFLKDTMENLEKLLTIPQLKEFEVKDLSTLLQRSKIRQYDDGEEIIMEGDDDALLFFLLSGGVSIVKNGREVATLKRQGDLFGEMRALGYADRSASVLAIGPTTCLTTDASRIESISSDDRVAFCYVLYRIFAEVLAERLRWTTVELIKEKEENERLRAKLGSA